MHFSTLRGDGFGPGGAEFSRQIFRDYPDIALMNTWRMVGKQGDIAYESRLHSHPRTNDPQQQIGLALVGWATYLKSKKVGPIIIDRRLDQWVEMSKAIVGQWLGEARKYFRSQVHRDASGAPVVRLAVQEPWASGARSGALYVSPSSPIGELRYSRKKDTGDSFNYRARLLGDDTLGDTKDIDIGGIDTPVTNGSLQAADARYAQIELQWDGESVTGNETSDSWFDLRVIGNHGLTLRGSQPNEGVWITDIMQWILATFYPKIEWAGEQNTFPVTHATFHDNRVYGHDLFKQLNDLVLWEMDVFEGPKLHYRPADLTKADWQFATTDPGVIVRFEGDSIENFANGVEVTYTGFDGVKRTLFPSDHAELRDDSESNPANRHGEDLWVAAEVTRPCTEAEALQFGRAYLVEYNRPKRPGTYRLHGGYIKDGAEHWHQGWKVRDAETLAITNHPFDEPRLITASKWHGDSNPPALDITVDGTSQLLEAIVARHELARQSKGLV